MTHTLGELVNFVLRSLCGNPWIELTEDRYCRVAARTNDERHFEMGALNVKQGLTELKRCTATETALWTKHCNPPYPVTVAEIVSLPDFVSLTPFGGAGTGPGSLRVLIHPPMSKIPPRGKERRESRMYAV